MPRSRWEALALAVSLTAALAATGTWAYTAGPSTQTDFIAQSDPGVRLHDDLDDAAATSGRAANDHDIYVENYGHHGQMLRVRLSEYMERDGVPLVAGTDPDTPAGWPVHARTGDTDPFHAAWTWTQGGAKWYRPTANHEDDPAAAAAAVADNHAAAYTADNAYSGTAPVRNPELPDTESAYVRETRPAAVLTLAQWETLTDAEKDALENAAWIVDEADGWAYWAGYLMPGEATGLLLTEVDHTSVTEPGAYLYLIHADLQAATGEDFKAFMSGHATARAMLRYYVNTAPMVEPDQGFYNPGMAYAGQALEVPDVPARFADLQDDDFTYRCEADADIVTVCDPVTGQVEINIPDALYTNGQHTVRIYASDGLLESEPVTVLLPMALMD
jgi:hypothetical protein